MSSSNRKCLHRESSPVQSRQSPPLPHGTAPDLGRRHVREQPVHRPGLGWLEGQAEFNGVTLKPKNTQDYYVWTLLPP